MLEVKVGTLYSFYTILYYLLRHNQIQGFNAFQTGNFCDDFILFLYYFSLVKEASCQGSFQSLKLQRGREFDFFRVIRENFLYANLAKYLVHEHSCKISTIL